MKKKQDNQNKSTLTITLEGVILKQLEKVKELAAEKTSAGAIRFAINYLPEYIDQMNKQNRENNRLYDKLTKAETELQTTKEFVKLLTKTKNS